MKATIAHISIKPMAHRSALLRMTKTHTLLLALGVALVLAACGSDPDDALDPNATYTAFGHPFEPAAALPVEAVLAEADLYLDDAVMIEGLARECADASCWMSLQAADTAEIGILQPDFSVPDTVAGRRIVVHGHLMAADTTRVPGGAANGNVDDPRPTVTPSSLRLHPTGLMIEKVRP